MKKSYWMLPILCLSLHACVEEAELSEIVYSGNLPAMQVSVQTTSVTLKADFSGNPRYQNAVEKGFILYRSSWYFDHENYKSETIEYYDTIRVDGDRLEAVVCDDLRDDWKNSVFPYFVSSDGLRFRGEVKEFTPVGGAAPEVSSVTFTRDQVDPYCGTISIRGKHLSKMKHSGKLETARATYGAFKAELIQGTFEQMDFAYRCNNIGEFPLFLTLNGVSVLLPANLVVDAATCKPLTEKIYPGIPYRVEITENGTPVNTLCHCYVDGKEVSVSNKFYDDDIYRVAFVGDVDKEHKMVISFKSNTGHEIFMPAQTIRYNSHWEQLKSMPLDEKPQAVIDGYAWIMTGTWNDYKAIAKLHRIDLATGEEKVFESPINEFTHKDVRKLAGYGQEQIAFGDTDGKKVYCSIYYWTYNHEYVLCLYEFDIETETWNYLADVSRSSSQYPGIQTWAKHGDFLYFMNYMSGKLGSYDLSSGELQTDISYNSALCDYYNEYIGFYNGNLYRCFNSLYEVSVPDLNCTEVLHDYVYNHFIFGSKYDEVYGGDRHVFGNRFYIGWLMCAVSLDDLEQRTYYGFTQEAWGSFLVPVGDKHYCIDENNQIWVYDANR